MDLVSVIMPVHNSKKHIKDSIESVIYNGYNNIEGIVIDDASTDNNVNVINAFGNKVQLIRLDKNNGVANVRNTGIGNASGRYIVFLDSDDLFKKGKLEKQIKFMNNNDIAFSYTSYDYLYEDVSVKRVNVPYAFNATKKEYR